MKNASGLIKLAVVLFGAAAFLAIDGCGKPPGVGAQQETAVGVLTPSYARVYQSVIQPKCVQCHNQAPFNFMSYESLMESGVVMAGNPNGSRLYMEIASGDMPKNGPPLSSDEIQMVGQWIANGAKETSVEPAPSLAPSPVASPGPTATATPVSDPIEPHFMSLNAHIFTPKCTRCHGGSNPDGRIDLTTYDGVVSTLKPGNPSGSKLYKVLAKGKMPKGGPKLTEEELKAVSDWITDGAPNN